MSTANGPVQVFALAIDQKSGAAANPIVVIHLCKIRSRLSSTLETPNGDQGSKVDQWGQYNKDLWGILILTFSFRFP